MPDRTQILIGCDKPAVLPFILEKMKGDSDLNLLVATRPTDILPLTKSLHFSLILLHFQSTPHSIDCILPIFKDSTVPIICLTNRFEEEDFSTKKYDHLFPYPLDYALQHNMLLTFTKAILSLGKKSTLTYTSFSDQYTRQSFAHPDNKLSKYVLELDQKRTFLLRIKEKIKQLYPDVSHETRGKLISIVNNIKLSVTDKHYWESFKMYLEEVNPKLIETLSTKHPCLTPVDIKYCYFLQVGLSNDDIRHMLGINLESVRTHKYRLKKKLDLPKDQDLHQYVTTLMASSEA